MTDELGIVLGLRPPTPPPPTSRPATVPPPRPPPHTTRADRRAPASCGRPPSVERDPGARLTTCPPGARSDTRFLAPPGCRQWSASWSYSSPAVPTPPRR